MYAMDTTQRKKDPKHGCSCDLCWDEAELTRFLAEVRSRTAIGEVAYEHCVSAAHYTRLGCAPTLYADVVKSVAKRGTRCNKSSKTVVG